MLMTARQLLLGISLLAAAALVQPAVAQPSSSQTQTPSTTDGGNGNAQKAGDKHPSNAPGPNSQSDQSRNPRGIHGGANRGSHGDHPQ
jgi:hypothetical protein